MNDTRLSTKGAMGAGECRVQTGLFVALVFGLSLFLYIPLFLSGATMAEQPAGAALLMWIPAGAAGITLIIRKQPFRFPRRSGAVSRVVIAVILAMLFPVVTGLIAYGIAWTAGLAEFISPEGVENPVGALLLAVLRAAVLGGVLGIPMVAGEELGWRAFLAPRLACSGIDRPVLMGGIIWGAWHTPLILTGQYAAGPIPLVAVVAFAVLAVSLHSLWTHWYLRTGSLWPAIVGHAGWNAVIQFPLDGHTAGDGAQLWVGDSGIIVALVCALLVGVAARRLVNA